MIYKRTTKGSEELALRVFGMQPALRPYLMRVNGKASVEALQGRNPDLLSFDASLKTLAGLGFVELVPSSASVPRTAAPAALEVAGAAETKPSVTTSTVARSPVSPAPAAPLTKAPSVAPPTFARAIPVAVPITPETPRPARETKNEAIPPKVNVPPVRGPDPVPVMPPTKKAAQTIVAPLKPAATQAEQAEVAPPTAAHEVPPSSQAESLRDLQQMKASMKKECQDLMGQDAEHLVQRINNCVTIGHLLLTMVSIKKIIALYAGDPAAENFEARYRNLAKVQAS